MTPLAVAETDSPRFVSVSDHAVLVEFATEFDAVAHERVLLLDRAIASSPPIGMVEVVPALINLLVSFDPVATDHEAIAATLRSLLAEPASEAPAPTVHEIQVCYHESLAPDLAVIARARGLSVEAVIDFHLAGDYRVLMYGFAPGYAYLSGVPSQIRVPRKATAVRGIAAGSVIIADQQCLVTTLEMPTGWSIIGRSPTEILPSDPDRPLLLDPGDRVVFRRIDLVELDQLANRSR